MNTSDTSKNLTLTEFSHFVLSNPNDCIVYFLPRLNGSWSVMTGIRPRSYAASPLVFYHLYTARGSLRVFSTLDAAVNSVYPLRDISEFHIL